MRVTTSAREVRQRCPKTLFEREQLGIACFYGSQPHRSRCACLFWSAFVRCAMRKQLLGAAQLPLLMFAVFCGYMAKDRKLEAR